MASTPDTMTPGQLQHARTNLWHQDGSALRTGEDARAWLDGTGLVPYYPHAQFAAPQGSFAEAILGRPENGWTPKAAAEDSSEESYAIEVEDDEPEDEVAGPDQGADEVTEEETGPEATEDEIMLSDTDEFEEDEGDEIAEEDRIDAGGDPVPNGLHAGQAPTPAPVPAPINGFSAEERETVRRTLARMVAEGSAVPLNLLGSAGSEPDFVCSAQAFSFVYTLRGDKGWKQEPAQTGSMRVSPLAAKVHEALKEKGAMTPQELASELGQGVVDSAVVRALAELWAILRVIPLGGEDGEPGPWELLAAHHIRQIKAGANAGQPTALSTLVSLYLAQVIAASNDEIEGYLSPLSARSRIREVVSALATSRQLDQIVVEGKTLFYMPGALAQLPADRPDEHALPSATPRSRYADDDRRAMIEAERAREATAGPAQERRPFSRPQESRASGGPGARAAGPRKPPFGDRAQGGFSPQRRTGGFAGPRREGGFAPRPDDRERRPFQRRDDGDAPMRPRNEFARPWDGESRERTPPPTEQSGRPAYAQRDGERRPGGDRKPSGDRKPFTPREGGSRPYAPRSNDRPYPPRREGARPYQANSGERRPFSAGPPQEDRPRENRRPFTPREGGERRPFTPRENNGERRPFVPREGGERRPFTPRGDRPFTPRGDRPFTPRGDRPFVPREQRTSSGDRPYRPREEGERKPFVPRGDRPFAPRGDRPSTPQGNRPFTPLGDRPFAPREGGGDRKPFPARKPFGAGRPEAGGGRPDRARFSGEPGEGRPAFQSGAKSAGPGGAKFGGSGFGRDRKGAPGAYGKPGFSPARRGPGSGPGRGGAPKRRPE